MAQLLTSSHFREPEIAKLDEARNALLNAWAQLREKLPAEQQAQIAQRPLQVEDVVNVVRKIEKNWQLERQKGIFGRMKGHLHRLCSGLASHSNLLQLLPSSSEYTSVFCGTLQTLIQVNQFPAFL